MTFVVGDRTFLYSEHVTRQTKAHNQYRTSIPTSTQQDLVLSPRASLFTTSGYAAAAMYCAEARDLLEPISNNNPGPVYGKQVPSMSWVVYTGLDTFGRLKMPQGSKKWSF